MAIHGPGGAWTKEASAHVAWSFPSQKHIEEFAFKLELLGRSGYGFYSVVHLSRSKR